MNGVHETVRFTDQSTADAIEKARRYLKHIADKRPNNPYFYDDGFPRESIADDAAATLAVFEHLAAAWRVDAVSEVLAEMGRAMHKFPTWPNDPLHALAVLGEEFGELTKDVLQMAYEPSKTSAANVRTEAMQTAAMALRFFMSLPRYEYRPGLQHSQAVLSDDSTAQGGSQ